MIEVSGLTQVYKGGKGIFDVSFKIGEGEIFGYLGPNGAGKTTTIRNLIGFVNRGGGTVSVNGFDPRKQPEKLQNDIGYLPGEIAFFDSMTGMQFVRFIAGMRKQKNLEPAKKLIERFELEPNTKIKKMSKGMKQKLGIVAAFMHNPKVLILDEPTSGLDPLMQSEMLSLVLEEKQKGKTVLMSSHSFEEIERTCDRAGIIRDGRLVSIEDVKAAREHRGQAFAVTLGRKADEKALLNSSLDTKAGENGRVIITVKNGFSEMFEILSKLDVKELREASQSIERTFMRFYGKEETK